MSQNLQKNRQVIVFLFISPMPLRRLAKVDKFSGSVSKLFEQETTKLMFGDINV